MEKIMEKIMENNMENDQNNLSPIRIEINPDKLTIEYLTELLKTQTQKTYYSIEKVTGQDICINLLTEKFWIEYLDNNFGIKLNSSEIKEFHKYFWGNDVFIGMEITGETDGILYSLEDCAIDMFDQLSEVCGWI